MEERERARTGIGSLKVRFNRVFGYYIEISKSNLHAVPADYQRKQTIAGGERFTTPALKEYEEKVLGADERILERELEIFEALRKAVAAEAPRIQDTARALATLDVLAGLAETAAIANFTKPHVHDGDEFVVTDARHPVVERFATDPFVPNDIDLNGTTRQLVILTGPEHGRQVDLSAADGADPAARADRIVRAGEGRQGADRRSHLRARRRIRQHRARPVDVHGGDAGDRQHPARRHVAQPRRARRDRPRHVDVRRPEHRVGGRRVPGEPTRRRGRRRCSPPTTTSSPISPTRCPASSTRTSPRASGRTTSSSCARSSRAIGSQLRHPGRAAGGPAAGVITRAREILGGLERDELSRGGRPTLSGVGGDPPHAAARRCSQRRSVLRRQ